MACKVIKVAMILPDLNFGGAQTMVIRLIKAINKEKFKVRLFIRDSKQGNIVEKVAEESGIDCVFLNIDENKKHRFVLLHKILAYRNLSRAIKNYNPDLIHSHLELFYTFLFTILNRIPLIVTVHSMPKRIYTKRLKLMISILQYINCLRVVGCSKKTSQEAKLIFNLKEENISTIYNPICLNEYKFGKKSTSDFIFIHIARLNPIKNQDLLLRAFSTIKKKNVKLWLIGDGNMIESLKSLAKKLNIEEEVTFMGNRGDVANLLSMANVFVLSSDSEACPMTVLEALASGLPVISTDVGGVRELVGDSGILVEARNVDQLSKAMLEIQKPDIYSKMANRTAIQTARKFSDIIIAKKYETLYGDTIFRNLGSQ